MPKQTKTDLLRENLVLHTQVLDLETKLTRLTNNYNILKEQLTTLPNKIVVPIQGTNTGAKAPTQNLNTNGIENSDTRVRIPAGFTNPTAPTYNQLYRIASLLANFDYHPGDTYDASTKKNAAAFIDAFQKHLNSIPNDTDKPWRKYFMPNLKNPAKPIQLIGDEWKSARNLQLMELLHKALLKYNVELPEPDMKEGN